MSTGSDFGTQPGHDTKLGVERSASHCVDNRVEHHTQRIEEFVDDRQNPGASTAGGCSRLVWKPDMDRIQWVVLKNARGHAYFEYGEPMLDSPARIRVLPLEAMSAAERQEFEGLQGEGNLAAWQETRLATGQDTSGSWVTVQEGIYRYSVQTVGGGLQVRSVLSEYLTTEVQLEH